MRVGAGGLRGEPIGPTLGKLRHNHLNPGIWVA